jgi:hypothetical protein
MECCIRVLMNLPRQSASALIAPKIAPLTLSDRIGFATSILEAAVVRDFKKMRDAAATNGTVCRKRDSSEKRLSYTHHRKFGRIDANKKNYRLGYLPQLT